MECMHADVAIPSTAMRLNFVVLIMYSNGVEGAFFTLYTCNLKCNTQEGEKGEVAGLHIFSILSSSESAAIPVSLPWNWDIGVFDMIVLMPTIKS